MKKNKITLLTLVLLIFVAALSLSIVASASTAPVIIDSVYVGEYSSNDRIQASGEAVIVFGTVDADATDYGIELKSYDNEGAVIKSGEINAERKMEDGKFGIAIYGVPNGLHTARVFADGAYSEEINIALGGYVVKFDANGAEGTESVFVDNGSVVLPTLTRDGYEFMGWATASDGEVAFAGGATVEVSANVTYYAIWEEEVSLTFNYDPVVFHVNDWASDSRYYMPAVETYGLPQGATMTYTVDQLYSMASYVPKSTHSTSATGSAPALGQPFVSGSFKDSSNQYIQLQNPANFLVGYGLTYKVVYTVNYMDKTFNYTQYILGDMTRSAGDLNAAKANTFDLYDLYPEIYTASNLTNGEIVNGADYGLENHNYVKFNLSFSNKSGSFAVNKSVGTPYNDRAAYSYWLMNVGSTTTKLTIQGNQTFDLPAGAIVEMTGNMIAAQNTAWNLCTKNADNSFTMNSIQISDVGSTDGEIILLAVRVTAQGLNG